MATKITPKFRTDKIVTLSQSTGVVSIQSGSILTIGGLQYELDAQKSVNLPTMTAHSRYQVYAVISGGDVILVVSSNENSIGPAGYTSWKLVGSLRANGSALFGSFITITGVPRTLNDITFDININSQGLGTLTGSTMTYTQNGNLFIAKGSFITGTRTAVEARFGMPFQVISSQSGTNELLMNSLGSGVNNTVAYGIIIPSTGASYVLPIYNSNGGPGFNTGVLGNTIFLDSLKVLANWQVPVSGWSNTPIEDL
jgi:hypothetical protein